MKQTEESPREAEARYASEVARISSVPPMIVLKVIDTQIRMLLRDLGVKGESQTVIGKVKLDLNDNVILEIPNSQIKAMTTKAALADRVMEELGQ